MTLGTSSKGIVHLIIIKNDCPKRLVKNVGLDIASMKSHLF
jgi:hypothetical protein